MSGVIELPSSDEQGPRRLHLRDVTSAESVISVGTQLKQARLEKNIDERAVASVLKMRIDQLHAIEADDFSKLPGRTYAVGFVKSYAKLVGLNAEQLVEQLRAQTMPETFGKPVELVFPEVTVQRQWPNGSIIVVGMVLAAVFYGIAQLTSPGPRAPVATANANEVADVVVVDAEAAPRFAKAVPLDGSIQGFSLSTRMSMPRPLAEHFSTYDPYAPRLIEASQPQQSAPAQSPFLPASTVTPATTGSRITIKAIESAYVQIKDPSLRRSKSIVVARLLNPGESVEAPDRAGLLLLTGNAGGIQVEVDGRQLGTLGKSGQVVSRVPLEPAYFLSRFSTSQ